MALEFSFLASVSFLTSDSSLVKSLVICFTVSPTCSPTALNCCVSFTAYPCASVYSLILVVALLPNWSNFFISVTTAPISSLYLLVCVFSVLKLSLILTTSDEILFPFKSITLVSLTFLPYWSTKVVTFLRAVSTSPEVGFVTFILVIISRSLVKFFICCSAFLVFNTVSTIMPKDD